MTIAELFQKANLIPRDPVQWKCAIPEVKPGVYLLARVSDPNGMCEGIDLPLVDFRDRGLQIELEYENQRWLRNEPILYIGKADRSVQKRVGQFYRHECGSKSPHAGGQILLLLSCLSGLWVYYSPADYPRGGELRMLRAFEDNVGQLPFANFDGERRQRRVRWTS